jgi:MFS family permease
MKSQFHHNEIRSMITLSLILAFRMLGLFMILPVFSVAALQLKGATPQFIGFALGVYGLTQAIFQIPLSMLSDKVGRKSVICFGLVLFLVGSLIAMFSESIWGVTLGRAIQGAGAIGSVALALLADVTRVENRTQAMAMMGIAIGFSFIFSMVLGPIIEQQVGLSGLFGVMGVLAFIGIFILMFVPQPSPMEAGEAPPEINFKLFKAIFFHRELLRLNVGIFLQHAILSASFIAIPYVLSESLSLSPSYYGAFYLSVFFLALVGTFPSIVFSEQRRCIKKTFVTSIVVLGFSIFLLIFWHAKLWQVITVLSFFFFAFTLLEAFLPSLVSKIAPINKKGTAMGIYSTFQFLGIFFGGIVGGIMLRHFDLAGVFGLTALFAILWLPLAITMKTPPYLTMRVIRVKEGLSSQYADKLNQQFLSVKGVAETEVLPRIGAIYLKIDRHYLDEKHLEKLIKSIQ